jgi:DNA-binding MarR family transcriptional regulator
MPRPKKHTAPDALPTPALPAAINAREPTRSSGKLATIIALLRSPDGATIDALCEATGWQSHSVRAIAGSLKRKGHVVTSTKPEDGLRRYRIEASA